MAPVAGLEQRVVQLAHQFGGPDIDRVLIAECPALHAEDKAERLDMAGQVREREADHFAFTEIVKLERPEIADEDVAGALLLGQGVEILSRLSVGLVEITPGALLLDDQHAGPEQVDETGAVAELGDMLLVAGDRSPPDAEHLEKVVVEALRLAGLVGGVAPFAGEGGGPDVDLVPGQAHGYCASLVKRSSSVSSISNLAGRRYCRLLSHHIRATVGMPAAITAIHCRLARCFRRRRNSARLNAATLTTAQISPDATTTISMRRCSFRLHAALRLARTLGYRPSPKEYMLSSCRP